MVRRLRDSEKPGGDQVAEEDAGGDDGGVHSVEGGVFVHRALRYWLPPYRTGRASNYSQD